MPACSGVDLWAIGCTFADILSPSDHALFPGGSDLEQLCLIFQAGDWLCLQFGNLILRVLMKVGVENFHKKAFPLRGSMILGSAPSDIYQWSTSHCMMWRRSSRCNISMQSLHLNLYIEETQSARIFGKANMFGVGSTFCTWAVKINSAMRRWVHLMKMTGQKFGSCQTIQKSPLQRGSRHLSS